jgi:hypothetical protein
VKHDVHTAELSLDDPTHPRHINVSNSKNGQHQQSRIGDQALGDDSLGRKVVERGGDSLT